MADFRSIVGHEQIIEHMKNAIALDKVSHAYIIDGPDKSGKMMLAKAFAQALQCREVQRYRDTIQPGEMEDSSLRINRLYNIESCGECQSCKQAVGGNQPDIIYVTHDKPNTISVEDIRVQINQDMEIRPYSSKYKIYIVDEAEKMNVQAQNALLKTLEEPPAYGVILLLTTNRDMMLQTIRSRCVTLSIKAVADEKIKGHLMRKCGVPDYQADLCVAFAQGNVGRAIMLSGSEEFKEIREYTMQFLRRLGDIPAYDLSQELKLMSEHKDQVQVFLDLLLLWFRDVLLYKSSNQERKLIFQDYLYELKQQADRTSYPGINHILEEIEIATRRLKFNVNYELTLELLMMEIKENIR